MPKLAPSTGDEFVSLPEELIRQILVRVPVKSLLRFKCVCKSWKVLISDPQFAKYQLRTSSADPNTTDQRLLSSVIGDLGVISFSLHAMSRCPSKPFTKARCFRMSDKYRILGSCNGLFCVTDIHYRFVMLLNPATKCISTRFPTSFNPKLSFTFHGFGYDHLNDKYKLLVVEEDQNLTVTKVFTFRENSWKPIQNFPCHRPTKWQGKLIGGTLHWLTKTKRGASDEDQRVILSFDVSTEAYGEVLLPSDAEHGSNPVLNVPCNCLSLCFFDSRENCWVVWLMNKHGIQDSWTKFMKIPDFMEDSIRDDSIRRRWTALRQSHHPDNVFNFIVHHSLDLLYISENGIVILKTEFSKMVFYDSKNGRFYYPTIRGDHRLHHLHSYDESLVSPLC